jgi:hypothetical protein
MNLNDKLPEYLLGKYQMIGTVTFIALFAIVFLNIYIPYSQTAWFGLGNSTTFIKTLLFVGISLIILIGSRMLMYQSKKFFKLSILAYAVWCLGESAAIAGLYTWITNSIEHAILGTSNELFYKAFMYGSIALGVPNLIAGMYLSIVDKNNTIKLMSYENTVTEEGKVEGSLKKITLFDNSGSLKLSLNIDSLYYIESDDNYIKVWYTDSKGELQQYMLRCRLKTVEESFKGSSLVRCNRKYIVNTDKVKVLRKESEGYVLDLDNEAIQPLPVTKTYTDIILSHFTDTQPLLEPLDE